ncbi:MAG: AAA domain-containing protein [Candidatus Gastranaerophilales bacterium]|nr:AAA domain-containing protein [Candidatus Gastranaerophilales bacterium]
MLQEATKILNSAFHNSFIKRLSLYLHDCVREEVKSSTFRNLKQDKDNKWIFLNNYDSVIDKNDSQELSLLSDEKLFTNFGEPLRLDGSDSYLTELMIQTEMSQKDKYLIYGYLFLVGKSGKNKRLNEFLTPLLYMPCKLERDGMNINCTLQDEVLSLNTGALTALMNKTDDEDEMEHMLDGLLEVVPELPLKEESLQIFLTTLKSIIPDIEIKLTHEDDEFENNVSASNPDVTVNYDNLDDITGEDRPKTKVKIDKVSITNQSAIILTKRPDVTAGVLHELTQISEKPSGLFRETALNVINEEYLITKGKNLDKQLKKEKELKDFAAITPLSLSDSQEAVIKKIEENPLVAVYGPPGTGKSQTIVNLVAHLIATGKTVLVASRMDKATDVVADRLNKLGAPYLALRAGRPNYQKQLSFELQDLLSNKVDLDSGFENAVLVDVSDMHKLLKSIKDIEDKCENIIKLEQEWQNAISERENEAKLLGKPTFITKNLKRDEIIAIDSVLKNLEKNLEKTGFLSNISNQINSHKLNKILKPILFHADYENIAKLRDELKLSELTAKARNIEAKIFKIGNLHQLILQMKTLKKKQRILAVEILKNKRRESLKGLLRDQVKRQRLIVHTKALVEKKRNLQNRLLEDEDFRPLLEAFPCWCVTTYAVSGSLPMKPGLFDVAIIDEASQCDIASCFPILYRSKKAVIVGDDKQLPHLSFLEKAKEQSFLSQYEIPDKYQLMWRFRTNSMFDLANYYSMSPVLLDEHFRCLEPIIEFSNREFYGDRMRIMTKNFEKKDVLELCLVQDGKVDSDATRNRPETEAIIKRVHEIILEDKKNIEAGNEPTTIGIISPFRGQVELIKKAMAQVFSDSIIRKHKIEVGTAHTFQGDERDIMVLSWAVADNSFSQSLTFLQKPNLFNVAITRAKNKTICFLSKNPKDLPQGLLKDYIEYIQAYEAKNKLETALDNELDDNIYKNNFEKEVATQLKEEGYNVKAGYKMAGFSTDLLVFDPMKNILLVECDGVEDNPKMYNTQIKKHVILERSGLKIERISFREWKQSKDACIERVKLALAAQ